MDEFKESQYIIYKNGDRYEIGKIKRVTDDGAFVYYSSGDTASKTPFECMHKLTNEYVIDETSLGGGAKIGRSGRAKDPKRVLDGLKACCKGDDCTKCPCMQYIYHCRRHLMRDAIAVIEALMKERGVANEADEAEPVRHCKWAYENERGGVYARCTACNEEIYQAGEYHYCPNCGAKVDGEIYGSDN